MRSVRSIGTAGIIGLAIFSIIHILCPVDGLKCYCDICADTNYTCETDGYCFASTNLDKDGITHARRCLDQGNWFPPEDPRDCKQGYDLSGVCCDKEYCNENVYPVLLSPEAPDSPKGTKHNNAPPKDLASDVCAAF